MESWLVELYVYVFLLFMNLFVDKLRASSMLHNQKPIKRGETGTDTF